MNYILNDEAEVSSDKEDEDEDDGVENKSLDEFIDEKGYKDDESRCSESNEVLYRIDNQSTLCPPDTMQHIGDSGSTQAKLSEKYSAAHYKMYVHNKLPEHDHRIENRYQPPILDKDQQRLDLVTQKGVYPDDHFDSLERFKETSLPPKEAFFNHLKSTFLKEEDYEHAQNVLPKFYHHLYLRTDILLLADVFTAFRKMYMEYYSKDPAHCLTTPCSSCQAALKMTDAELELINIVEILSKVFEVCIIF